MRSTWDGPASRPGRDRGWGKVKSVIVAEDGTVRCPVCGSTAFSDKRTGKAKWTSGAIGIATLGVGGVISVAAMPKRLNCRGCGANLKRADPPKSAKPAKPTTAERQAQASAARAEAAASWAELKATVRRPKRSSFAQSSQARPETYGGEGLAAGTETTTLGEGMSKKTKLLDQAQEHLANEQVESCIECTIETKMMGNDSTRKGILIATDRRIVFYAKKMGGYQVESFEYAKLSSFEQGKSMMGATLSFFASGNKVSVKWIQDEELGQFVETVRNHTSHQETPVSEHVAAPNSATSDPVALLKQLGELREAGLLTDAEFEEKRQELVRRL